MMVRSHGRTSDAGRNTVRFGLDRFIPQSEIEGFVRALDFDGHYFLTGSQIATHTGQAVEWTFTSSNDAVVFAVMMRFR